MGNLWFGTANEAIEDLSKKHRETISSSQNQFENLGTATKADENTLQGYRFFASTEKVCGSCFCTTMRCDRFRWHRCQYGK